MIFRFDGFEVDTDTREVRRGDRVCALQPQAFALLEYLIRHRDRTVPKRELLEQLWTDVVVGEGSIQRAVSLVRAALGDQGACIRTVPKLGYRFTAAVEAIERAPQAPPPFQPRFARSGDIHIAYYTLGEGELDLVVVPGWAFPMRAFLGHPDIRRGIEELGRFGRVILFDKRGTGLSDRVKELPTLEQRMDDLRAVLEACGSRRALLIGYSEGGPLCLLYATTFPERTRGLLLGGAFARWTSAPDYPHGWSDEVIDRLRDYIAHGWGRGDTIRAIVESRSGDPDIVAWAARAEQEGASPGAALELLEMNLQVDVRPLLGAVSVPVVVLHHTQDAVIHVDNGRYLAAHLPGARLMEVEGRDHVFLLEHRAYLAAAIEWLISCAAAESDRFLTTLVCLECPEPPAGASLDELAARYRGARAGAGLLWSFDGPQRAVDFAHAALSLAAAASARAGVHTGEATRRGAALAGAAADGALALARAAAPGEVWVSRVVRDLVQSPSLAFSERGEVAIAAGAAPLVALGSSRDGVVSKR